MNTNAARLASLYNNASFIEITAQSSPTGVPFCWNTSTNAVVFAKDSIDAEFFNLFVVAPAMFQTLEAIAARLSVLNEKLLNSGIDESDEIDYLIRSAIDCQNIALNGLSNTADRKTNEERKFKR